VWLIGAVVCLLDAPWVQLLADACNGLIRDCKVLLATSLSHVSSTIASAALYLHLVAVITLSMLTVTDRKQGSKLDELQKESEHKRYRNLPPRDRLRLRKQQQADEEAKRIALVIFFVITTDDQSWRNFTTS